ncbi:hypothetical protein YN1HA_18050 [Sulfurisphaera ohwakuensis]
MAQTNSGSFQFLFGFILAEQLADYLLRFYLSIPFGIHRLTQKHKKKYTNSSFNSFLDSSRD